MSDMSATANHWATVEANIDLLAEAHVEFSGLRLVVDTLLDTMRRAVFDSDESLDELPVKLREAKARAATARSLRDDASARLVSCTDAIRLSLEAENHEEQTLALLDEARRLAELAREGAEPGISDALRKLTVEIRARLREARRPLLYQEILELSAELEMLGEMGEGSPSTEELLKSEAFLELGLEDARQRLANEIGEVRKRVKALEHTRRRQTAQGHLDSIIAISSQDGPVSADQLMQVIHLVEQIGEMADEVGLRRWAQPVLRACNSCASTATTREAWIYLAALLSEGQSVPDRLLSVVDALPSPPDDDADAVGLLESFVLKSGYAGEAAEEYWPVIEALHASNMRWARALFTLQWGTAPTETGAEAHWLLETWPSESTQERLSRVKHGANGLDRVAIDLWDSPDGGNESCSQLALAWIERVQGVTSASALREALPHIGSLSRGLRAAIVTAAAWMTGEASERSELEDLRHLEEPVLRDGLTYLGTLGRDGVRTSQKLWDRHPAPGRQMDELGPNRSPVGGPASTVWQTILWRRLNELRSLSAAGATRQGALQALEEEDPDSLVRAAVTGKFRDVNPGAKETMREWVQTWYDCIRMECGAVPAPPELLKRPEAAREALDRLVAQRPADDSIVALIRRFLEPVVAKPLAGREPASSSRFSLREALLGLVRASQDPWTWWRVQAATEEAWREAACKDALARLAGLSDFDRCFDGCLQLGLFELAATLLERAPPSDRGELEARLTTGLEYARTELQRLAEIRCAIPLSSETGRWPCKEDHSFRAKVSALADRSMALIDGVRTSGLPVTRARLETLATEVEKIVAEAAERREREVRALESRLAPALRRGFEGVADQEADQLVSRLGILLHGFRDVPTIPPQALVQSAQAPRPTTVATSIRVRKVSPVHLADLSSRLRFSWDALADTTDSQLDQTPGAERTLRAARDAYRGGDGAWRELTADWAVEEGYSRAVGRALHEAQELALDALRLLAGSEKEDTPWRLDQALALWLRCSLERSGSSLAHTALPSWSDTKGEAGLTLTAELVRRFFEYRLLDYFETFLLNAVATGGHILPRTLVQIDDHDRIMRKTLLRQVLRRGSDITEHRAVLAVELLSAWLPPDSVPAAERRLLGLARWDPADFAKAERVEEFVASLSELGLDAIIAPTVQRALQQRHVPIRKNREPTLNVWLASPRLYALDDDLNLVAEVIYTEGGGAQRDLVLQTSFSHPSYRLAPESVDVPIPELRPGDVHEVHIRLTPTERRNVIGPRDAQVTLKLFRRGSRGLVSTIAKRIAAVELVQGYPHVEASAPYVAGKRVPSLEIIKGRDQEVADLLARLRGTHTDNFVLIYGVRRIGKSTFLQRVALDLRLRETHVPVHLDLEELLRGNQSVSTLLSALAKAISRSEHPDISNVELNYEAHAQDPYAWFRDYLTRIAEAIQPRRLLLMFDEFQFLFDQIERDRERGFGPPQATLHDDLIRSFRHWVQYLPVAIVVAGTPELEQYVIRRADRLFQLGLSIQLDVIDRKAARELIVDPVREIYEVTTRAKNRLILETGCFPHLIQRVCMELFLQVHGARSSVATEADVEKALAVVAKDRSVFHDLLGPARERSEDRQLVRALADIGVDDERGTIEDISSYLTLKHRERAARQDWIADRLAWFAGRKLVTRYRNFYRLNPPLLARHVISQAEYDLL